MILFNETYSYLRGVRFKSSGGGTSGAVQYPAYLENLHEEWLGSDIVGTSVTELINAGHSDNPLEGISYTDPSPDITDIGTEVGTFKTSVGALAETTDWPAILTQAVTSVGGSGVLNAIDVPTIITAIRSSVGTNVDAAIAAALDNIDDDALVATVLGQADGLVDQIVADAIAELDETKIADVVQAFIDTRRVNRARIRTQYKAGMANVSAERGSAYAIGLALLESEFEKEVSQFQSDLTIQVMLQNRDIRLQGLQSYVQFFQANLSARIQAHIAVQEVHSRIHSQGMQAYADQFRAEALSRLQGESANKQSREALLQLGISQMLQHKQFIQEMKRAVATLMAETKRISFGMDSEYIGNTADLNWKYASWDWEVYHSATAVLGGLGGASFVPKGPTKAGSTISGVLGGTGTGAATGAMFGPAGAAIGAGAGALLGGLAGLFG